MVMFDYYFQLGLCSLWCNLMFIVLMVMVIGFGVVVLMIIYLVFCVVLGNLIFDKLVWLFILLVDNWGLQQNFKGELVDGLDYVDVIVLMCVYVVKCQIMLYLV